MSAAMRREVIELAASEVFGSRGYHRASMAEIARRSGVSVPVVYDHFASKRDLHRRLLERHFAELREVWRVNLAGDDPHAERMARSFGAWFEYVQAHPYAWRMLFRDTTGDPEIEALHREIIAASRMEALPMLAREPGAKTLADAGGSVAVDLLWEVIRAVLQGLAMWWYDHRQVPREEIVATAMNTLWLGMERVGGGELWSGAPSEAPRPADP